MASNSIDLYAEMSAQRKLSQAKGDTPHWMTTGGYQMFTDKLSYQGETYKEAIDRIAIEGARHSVERDVYGRSELELRERFTDIFMKGWLAPATPVLANMGTDRGLPVSCSGSYIEDSIDDFYAAYHEAAILSKTGHGCSTYLGDIRPRGSSYCNGEGTADGVIPVIESMLKTVTTVSQGGTRRGATAFNIELTHGDIREVLDFHLANPKRLQITYIVEDTFIDDLNNGVEESLAVLRRFMKVRMQGGKAFVLFTDKANRHAKELGIDFEGLLIKGTNLCTEIMLPSNEKYTFSCIISSVNVFMYDEWCNDELFIHDCILFLNAVADSYLEHAPKHKGNHGALDKIIAFTEKFRALGLGALGVTSYMQSKMYPYEGLEAKFFNQNFFTEFYKQARSAGDHYDNATVVAIAPNVTSALVAGGVSQGIELFTANVFTQETSAGDVYRMNPVFLKLMKDKGIATEENINVIKRAQGSIQGNPLFTDLEQAVFKTAYEVDQGWSIVLANDRGSSIDQGQSLNLFFPDSAEESEVMRVMHKAFMAPYVKSLYYSNTSVGVLGSTGECMMCAS